MLKIILFAGGILFFFLNLSIMFKKPTKADASIKGYAELVEIDRSNDIWRDIGRFYQFLTFPFQCLVFSITMALFHFSLLNTAGVYISIGALMLAVPLLLAARSKLQSKLASNEGGAERVLRMIKMGIRASVSLSITIYAICIGFN